MIQLGRFDELGSGLINIHKYLPAYSNGALPLFEDTREGFRLTLPLRIPSTKNAEIEPGTPQVGEQVSEQVSAQVLAILKAAAESTAPPSAVTTCTLPSKPASSNAPSPKNPPAASKNTASPPTTPSTSSVFSTPIEPTTPPLSMSCSAGGSKDTG